MENIEELEIWKKCVEYPNYEVSSLGFVRRICIETTTQTGVKRNYPEKLITQSLIYNGYMRIHIYNFSRKYINVLVHRLVAQEFIENKLGNPQVNHKNGIKTDNRVENLEWCSAKENTNHACETGLRDNKGARNGRSILNQDQVDSIREEFNKGVLDRGQLALKHSVSRNNITLILRKGSWK